MSNERTYLDVPFSEKNKAKTLGAWWDPEKKKWFVPTHLDPKNFSHWFIEETPPVVNNCTA